MVASDLYDISPASRNLEELRRMLRRRHVILKQAWVTDIKAEDRADFLICGARSGQCVFP